MQPSTDQPSGGSGGTGRQLRRYGPIAAILVVLAVIAGVLVFAGGGDDDDDEATTSGESTSGGPEGVLSYQDAEDQGRLDEVTFPDGCVALLRAYRLGEPEPVWDQSGEQMCTMALVPVELAPGATQEVATPTASGYDILGEDLPDGEYRITIYLRPDGEVVEIDAGTTDLAIPR